MFQNCSEKELYIAFSAIRHAKRVASERDMKRQYRLALGLTILALIMTAIPSAFALLPRPIGSTVQEMPFESNPTAVEAGSLAGEGTNVWDRDPISAASYLQLLYGGAAPFRWGVTGFSKPSDTGETDFAIGSVTLHIQYSAHLLGTDDTYRLVYYVGAAGPFVLTDWMGGGVASPTNYIIPVPTADQLSRSWGEISDLGDGTWTWDEINSLVVRVEFQLVATTDGRPFRFYEIWLTVYPTAPPNGGSTVSVQPVNVVPLPFEDGTGVGTFFIDIYAHNMVYETNGLQIAEFTLDFDPAVINVWEDPNFVEPPGMYVYWPWTTENWFTYDNAVGQISGSLAIPVAHVLVDYGLQGSFPVARIYFLVLDQTTQYSELHFSVSTMVAPGGIYIVNTPYDGSYGGAVPEFPFGVGIITMLAPLALLGYLWRTRRKTMSK